MKHKNVHSLREFYQNPALYGDPKPEKIKHGNSITINSSLEWSHWVCACLHEDNRVTRSYLRSSKINQGTSQFKLGCFNKWLESELLKVRPIHRDRIPGNHRPSHTEVSQRHRICLDIRSIAPHPRWKENEQNKFNQSVRDLRHFEIIIQLQSYTKWLNYAQKIVISPAIIPAQRFIVVHPDPETWFEFCLAWKSWIENIRK